MSHHRSQGLNRSVSLNVESFESRLVPSTVGSGANPELIPSLQDDVSRATVKVVSVWDTNGNGVADSGDTIRVGSGAVVGQRHVVTAAHQLYNREVSTSAGGAADFVSVFAGQSDASNRAFGEAVATRWTWMGGYPTAVGQAEFASDLAVIAVDRNLAQLTGAFTPGAASDAEFVQSLLQLNSYPAADGFDGQRQFRSVGSVASIQGALLQYQESQLFTATGSSGGALTLPGSGSTTRLVGIHLAGYAGRDDASLNSGLRLTQEHLRFIESAMNGDSVAVDRSQIVATNTWFSGTSRQRASTVDRTQAAAGEAVTVSVPVTNLGTAASDVRVRFRLSFDSQFDESDIWLGEATLSNLGSLQTGMVTLATNLPAGLVPVTYTVVWSVEAATGLSAPTPVMDLIRGSGSQFGSHTSGITIRAADPVTTPPISPPIVVAPVVGAGDRFEGATGNGSRDTASDWGTISNRAEGGLSLHQSTDVDFYSYVAAESGSSRIRLTGTSVDQVVLRIFDESGNLLAASQGNGDAQQIVIATTAGQRYWLQVSSPSGAVIADYRLQVDANAIQAGQPQLVGAQQFVVGGDRNSNGLVRVFRADGSERAAFPAFDFPTGGIRTASADFTGDGIADYVVATGPGTASLVRVIDGATLRELFRIAPFEASFVGGVYVSAGDLTGDGIADLVVTPDEGGGPRVRAFRGSDFSQLADFFGIDDPNFRGGARSGIGDVNGDGAGDLLVVAGFMGGPRVAGFDGRSLGSAATRKLFNDFFAFEVELRNGVYITAGDLDGDGFAEVIVGGGPGGGPRVTAFSGRDLLENRISQRANFFGGDAENRSGVRLTVKNLDGDNRADLVVGAGTDSGSRVTSYLGRNVPTSGSPIVADEFDAFAGYAGGIFVG